MRLLRFVLGPQEDPGFRTSGMPHMLFLGTSKSLLLGADSTEAQQPQLWFLTNDTRSEHMSTLPPPQTFGKAQPTLAPSAGT